MCRTVEADCSCRSVNSLIAHIVSSDPQLDPQLVTDIVSIWQYPSPPDTMKTLLSSFCPMYVPNQCSMNTCQNPLTTFHPNYISSKTKTSLNTETTDNYNNDIPNDTHSRDP